MKNLFLIAILLISFGVYSQNVQVDSQNYSPQELIEDILINSSCISNVQVTNVVGGNFSGSDESYGYFSSNGSSFPFQSGIVLSTGKLQNVEGPNNSLSDDDAPNWGGDNDLEQILDEPNTLNATILEFEFTSTANQISFRYLFASEEYQEGNSNTCQYSDLFGFLIRPADESQYTNIALIPNTDTPVKVTTVHSGIPGACDPINEEYFGSWNGSSAPINFNGQTAVLTAVANVTPNETYHVKLVIADEYNYRYDSAVFLEAGSFELGTDLGPSRLFSQGNPICDGDSLELDATQAGNNQYDWFQNGNLVQSCVGCGTYNVTSPGTYNVEVTLDNGCISYGEVLIEYSNNPDPYDASLVNCDFDGDGYALYNLFESESLVISLQDQTIVDFYHSEADAISNQNPIQNSNAYTNSLSNEVVYARVENYFGCFGVAEVSLELSYNLLPIVDFGQCDDNPVDGFTLFNFDDFRTEIENSAPTGSNISFFSTLEDAETNQNPLPNSYTNTIAYLEPVFVKITNNNECFAISETNLVVNQPPTLLADESLIYCTNFFPDTVTLNAGVLGNHQNLNFQWTYNGVDLNLNAPNININETGTYIVQVTNSDNCSTSRTITIDGSNPATIQQIITTENPNNITVQVTGDGNYVFSIDQGPFGESNYFSNVSAGFHSIEIRDLNGCGGTLDDVAILGFPAYFTPNGDSDNDSWEPLGVTWENYSLKIQIFDRFGKLLKEIHGHDTGWNGTYQGKHMPTDDYWYKATLPNGKEYMGHFALKR